PRHDLYSLGVMWYQLLVGDVRREMRHGWERELEGAGVGREHVELVRRCVGWFQDRPRDGGDLLPVLPQQRPPVDRRDEGVGAASPPPARAPLPPSESEASPDELRRLLLLDPKDDALRLRYLAVRTPELRESDRRHVGGAVFHVMVWCAMIAGLLAFGF